MTFKKPTRAGLLALIFGVLLGVFLTVSTYTPIYAQEPAPVADTGASGPSPAARPLSR